jgi:hypothetical protein
VQRPQPDPLGGAASTDLRTVLAGPPRPARVLAEFPGAAYVDVDGEVVALLAPNAVRLPFAVLLPAGPPPLGVVTVGAGVVQTGEAVVQVRRWWTPARPRPPAGGRTDAIDDLAAALAAGDGGTDRDIVDRTEALAAGLAGRDAAILAATVQRLVGRGPGLTPAGDDVLAGALLAGHGGPVATRLAAALPDGLRQRTTALAAALLRAAVRGSGTTEGVAVVDAVRGHRSLAAPLRRLLAVGHTSGADTALGILVGARAAIAAAAGRHEESA